MASLLPNTTVLGNANAKHLLRRASLKRLTVLVQLKKLPKD
jgi:hypothetical protein